MTKKRTAAELEELVRNGDTTITPEDIEHARAVERHDLLLAEAKSRAELADADARRNQQIAVLRDDIAAVSNDVDNLGELAVTARAALVDLIEALQARGTTLSALAGRAKTLGIVPMDATDVPADPSGIGWRGGPGTGRDVVLVLDDRILGTVAALDVVGRMVHDLTARYKLRDRRWRAESTPPVETLISGIERRYAPPERVTLRLLSRWGHKQPGTIVQPDAETGRWLVSKGMAEAA